MASSSDESFAWTNASNSSESSIEKEIMTNNNGTVNGLDDDCDYERSYKKKLHKKLSLNNETTETTHEETKNERKRKRLDDVVESPKKKKIKLEPESDADTCKKKKKKSINHSQSNDDSKVDVCEYQNNLNTSVKQESDPELLSPKVKKHKKNSLNLSVNENDVTNTTSDTNNLNHSEDNDESYTSKKKKKKSKKKKLSESDDNNEKKEAKFCEEKHSHTQDEETESENRNQKNEAIMPKMEIGSEDEINDFNNSELSSKEEKANKNNIKLKSIDKSLNETNDHSAKTKKRVSIKSEKTKADDEGNSTIDHDISIGVHSTDSRKLQKFLKVNGNLKPILNKERGDWVVSPDDEVWAIRCPHSIDINAFLGVNIKLDRKCKIKVDGQTYVGTMNSETDSVTVLSLQNNNYVIKKIPLNGTLHLRKRIPKINIEHNNTVTNNEHDFVPLPVTKNRHPLFGSNYKKAIKVPSAIAQRLKDPYSGTICDNEKVKKSKKKKHKRKSLDIDNEQLDESKVSVLENDETRVEIKKKNRKRKHAVEDEDSNSKRVKHSDSTVWESEQAIEENLFNF